VSNPFVRALEAIFISVVSSLQSEVNVLENLVTKLLSDLEDSIQQEKLKDMLQYTKKLSEFYQGVVSTRDAINEVLDQGSYFSSIILLIERYSLQYVDTEHSYVGCHYR
jgi:magnesium transporter